MVEFRSTWAILGRHFQAVAFICHGVAHVQLEFGEGAALMHEFTVYFGSGFYFGCCLGLATLRHFMQMRIIILRCPWLPLPLSMTASDYNRDAIVICIGSVTVWRGTKPKAFFFRCVFCVCVTVETCHLGMGQSANHQCQYMWVSVRISLVVLAIPIHQALSFHCDTHTHTHTQKGREHMLAIAFELNL